MRVHAIWRDWARRSEQAERERTWTMTSGGFWSTLWQMQVDEAPAEQSEDGVDLTLVRWMLSLTPAERVEWIDGIAKSLQELRELNDER